jgi:hypothetical protein
MAIDNGKLHSVVRRTGSRFGGYGGGRVLG